jgi:hypothetical protein
MSHRDCVVLAYDLRLEVHVDGNRIKIDAFEANRQRLAFRALPVAFRPGRGVGELAVNRHSVSFVAVKLRERLELAAKQIRRGAWVDLAAYDAVAPNLDWVTLPLT